MARIGAIFQQDLVQKRMTGQDYRVAHANRRKIYMGNPIYIIDIQ